MQGSAGALGPPSLPPGEGQQAGERYPVAPDVLAWMRREIRSVRGLIEQEAAFEGVRAVPIHGDVWSDNILIEPSGGSLLIDWDGLAIGDPVLDCATLLWPLLPDGGDAAAWLGSRARDAGLLARLEVCRRAALLEEVIDPLADWVEAKQMPAHGARVRPEKLRVHTNAIAEYRRRYGNNQQ